MMDTTAFQEILYEKDKRSGLVVVTLNTPERKNALSVRTFLELFWAVDAVGKDDAVRAMIFTGAPDPANTDPGRQAFSAGAYFRKEAGFLGQTDASLTEAEKTQIDFEDIAQKKLTLKLWQLDKPVIAALNGYAIGAGFTMPLAGADLMYASEHAWAWLPFVRLGIVPEFGATLLLPRLLGFQKAKELLFLAEKIPARQLLELGLVNKVLPHGEVFSYAKEVALKLIPPRGAGLAVRKTKRALHDPLISDLSQALDQENKGMGEAFASFDHIEAATARFERREPIFQGK